MRNSWPGSVLRPRSNTVVRLGRSTDLGHDMNPNLAVFSEGPIDQINEPKAEIDDYLNRAKKDTNGSAKKPKASEREKV